MTVKQTTRWKNHWVALRSTLEKELALQSQLLDVVIIEQNTVESGDASSHAWNLLDGLEPNMAYTMEDFIRETREQFLHSLTPEERQAFLAELDLDERLRGLGPDDLRKIQEYLKTLN